MNTMRTSTKRHFKDKKVPNVSYNWTEKYNTGAQRETKWGKRINQQAERQNNRPHPDKAAKKKRI